MDEAGIVWMLDHKNNMVWHNGGTTNFNSYIAFNKEKKTGVVVLGNISPNRRIPMTVIGVKIMKELTADKN